MPAQNRAPGGTAAVRRWPTNRRDSRLARSGRESPPPADGGRRAVRHRAGTRIRRGTSDVRYGRPIRHSARRDEDLARQGLFPHTPRRPSQSAGNRETRMTGQTPDLRDRLIQRPVPSPRASGTMPGPADRPAAPADPMARPAAIGGTAGTGDSGRPNMSRPPPDAAMRRTDHGNRTRAVRAGLCVKLP